MSSAQGRIEDGEAVKAAILALRANLAAQGTIVADPEIVVRRVVAAYLPVYNRIRGRGRKWHPTTHALASMAVADCITVQADKLTELHNKMRGARVIMGNEDAVWTSVRMPDGAVKITRLEDGAKRTAPISSPLTVALTQMGVGESRIVLAGSTDRRARVSTTFYSDSARRAMHQPDARWTFRTTSKGLRATRVA